MTQQRSAAERLRRAVAELAIIVVGVLLALSADQWRASRADAKLEAAYLSALLDDINSARDRLKRPLELTTRFLSASERLASLSKGDATVSHEEVTRLVGDSLFNLVSWNYRLPTLQDLKNTGRVGLISDQQIRRALAEVDRFAARIDGAQDDLAQTQHQTVDPFLVRRADLPAMLPTAASHAALHLGPALGIDHRSLLTEPEFQNIIGLRIVILLNIKSSFEEMDEHLDQLSGLIRAAR